jgi:hypothetical protein
MFSQLFDHIVQEEQESDFDSHFQPATPEEGESRVMDYIKSICTQNPDGTWSSEGDVNLEYTGLDKFPVKFKSVGGYFYCYQNKLPSLEGAPEEVGGDFDCSYNQLKTLEGAPKKVEGVFSCSDNKLKTLEGAPKEVGGSFNCYNNQLKTLEGAPKEVGGDFYCSYNQLKTLEGAPKEVGGDFYCSNNQLISLEGAPEEVGGNFYCGNNSKSVEDLKRTIDRPYMDRIAVRKGKEESEEAYDE